MNRKRMRLTRPLLTLGSAESRRSWNDCFDAPPNNCCRPRMVSYDKLLVFFKAGIGGSGATTTGGRV